MVAQRGKDTVLKLGSSDTSPITYQVVAGVRNKTLKVNRNIVDVTDSDSFGEWRELLASSGVRTMSISATGIFKSAQSQKDVFNAMMEGLLRYWQIIIPELGTFQGKFQVSDCQLDSPYADSITFDITLESAGYVQFNPSA